MAGDMSGWDWTSFEPPQQPVVPVALEHPRSRPVMVSDTPEMAEYRTLAARLGYTPQGVEDPTLDRVLQELGIEVFDLNMVQDFLGATCRRLGPKWRWEWTYVGQVSVSSWSFGMPYTLPIPLRVLRRMDALRDRLPSVAYSVSRITDQPKSDPFLLATFGGVSRVIDCWDEPGFTG